MYKITQELIKVRFYNWKVCVGKLAHNVCILTSHFPFVIVSALANVSDAKLALCFSCVQITTRFINVYQTYSHETVFSLVTFTLDSAFFTASDLSCCLSADRTTLAQMAEYLM